MIFSDKLLERKKGEYYWNIKEEDLSDFYEELFNFLFYDGNIHRLDEFLLVSENRLAEFIKRNEKGNYTGHK